LTIFQKYRTDFSIQLNFKLHSPVSKKLAQFSMRSVSAKLRCTNRKPPLSQRQRSANPPASAPHALVFDPSAFPHARASANSARPRTAVGSGLPIAGPLSPRREPVRAPRPPPSPVSGAKGSAGALSAREVAAIRAELQTARPRRVVWRDSREFADPGVLTAVKSEKVERPTAPKFVLEDTAMDPHVCPPASTLISRSAGRYNFL
jgi:hypothetical protein